MSIGVHPEIGVDTNWHLVTKLMLLRTGIRHLLLKLMKSMRFSKIVGLILKILKHEKSVETKSEFPKPFKGPPHARKFLASQIAWEVSSATFFRPMFFRLFPNAKIFGFPDSEIWRVNPMIFKNLWTCFNLINKSRIPVRNSVNLAIKCNLWATRKSGWPANYTWSPIWCYCALVSDTYWAN